MTVLNQFKSHEGQYGPRNFWVESGKFYYKRQDDEVNLPKVELLPVNDTLYMDMTRLGTLMAFTKTQRNLVSKSYSLDDISLKWILRDKNLNVFEKD